MSIGVAFVTPDIVIYKRKRNETSRGKSVECVGKIGFVSKGCNDDPSLDRNRLRIFVFIRQPRRPSFVSCDVVDKV